MNVISEQYLKQTAARTVERICLNQCSEKDIKSMISCLTEEQQQDFFLACNSLESHLIKQETSIDRAWADGDHESRSELKHTRPAIKKKVQAAAMLSEVAQTFSDHSIRGSIHFLNQYIKNKSKSV